MQRQFHAAIRQLLKFLRTVPAALADEEGGGGAEAEAHFLGSDDTILLLGVDYFNGALAIYRSLKANGQLEGLQPVLLEMGRRFTRGPVTPEPEAATLTVLPEPMAPAA